MQRRGSKLKRGQTPFQKGVCPQPTIPAPIMTDKISKTDEQWRAQLSAEQFQVTRKHGTERAFTGQYWDSKDAGTYRCICCDHPLFDASTKFDSGTGWPSFWQPLAPDSVATETDNGFFMRRTEVLCSKCDAHLGHVFEDGPKPTGLRYCMNSASLRLEKKPA